jgi:hypothetical protein
MMALHARRWLAGAGFRVPGLAVCQLTLPIGFAVLTMFIEALCGMLCILARRVHQVYYGGDYCAWAVSAGGPDTSAWSSARHTSVMSTMPARPALP